ncbi:MAG: type II secretion system F family protein [Patescibacteria group bacterium]|nr:type II secretion system F family protein [Patescibacteria group bacterium]
MDYIYTASSKKGDIKKGAVQAASKEEAKKMVEEEGLMPITIHAKGEKTELQAKEKKGINISLSFGRVSTVEKVLFAKNMAVMIKAGLSLKEALEVVYDQAKGKFKKVLGEIIGNVEAGKNLAESMEKYPKIFPNYFTSIIRVSEESGTLEENMAYLAEHMEADMALKRKIRSAMMYPGFVIGATVILGLTLGIFVLPKVTKLFESMDAELPITTRALMWISEMMQSYGLYIAIGVVVGVIFLFWFLRLKFIRPFTHRILLHFPIVSKISKNMNLARFNRNMSILLRSGLPIDRSLEIGAETLNNYIYKKDLAQASEEVKKGIPLSESLVEHENEFPSLETHMLRVGEDSGNLEETMSYLSGYYEEEVNNITENLTTILEPVLLVGIGLVVGGLALSIITPIYSISSTLTGK